MKNANFIAIDFETATAKREPCQIGVIVVKENQIIERISRLIKPPHNKYTKQCIAVHGITPDMTKDSLEFDKVWGDIKGYFEGNFVVAHKASFDLDVLYKALDLYNIPHPILMGTACTYQLSGKSLEDSCLEHNIPLVNHHDGACDAEACANLFLKYLNGELHKRESANGQSRNKANSDFIGHSERQYSDNFDEVEIRAVRHFNTVGYQRFLEDCSTNDPLSNFTVESISSLPTSINFYNKRFIITGGTIFDRERAYQIIKKLGGKKASSVSSSLDYAILGEEPGPKKVEQLEGLKADGYSINIMSDTEFVEFVKLSLKTVVQ